MADKRRKRICIKIEDDSDCETCTKRNESEWQMLLMVKCYVISCVTCKECYRTVDILVEASDVQEVFDARR